jgi:hypothetical protein
MAYVPSCPNLVRTLLALAGSDAVSLQIYPTPDRAAHIAHIVTVTPDGISMPVFSADEDMVGLLASGVEPVDALIALNRLCGRPEHLAALDAEDL